MPPEMSPFAALIDDAAIFPPGEAPLPAAVRQHHDYRSNGRNAFVGPFVVGAGSLFELAALVSLELFPGGLPVSVVVPPGGLSAALDVVDQLPNLTLAGVEVKLAGAQGAEDEIRDVSALHAQRIPAAALFVEVGRPTDEPSPDWCDAVATVARCGARLKFRTGGVTMDTFPSEKAMAIAITTAVTAHAPFKCTAGLHNAVRHSDPHTGFEHHGFLNILLATADALDGAREPEVRNRLQERSGSALAAAARSRTDAGLHAARSMFVSYGSCSVDEPLADLRTLDLLHLDNLEST